MLDRHCSCELTRVRPIKRYSALAVAAVGEGDYGRARRRRLPPSPPLPPPAAPSLPPSLSPWLRFHSVDRLFPPSPAFRPALTSARCCRGARVDPQGDAPQRARRALRCAAPKRRCSPCPLRLHMPSLWLRGPTTVHGDCARLYTATGHGLVLILSGVPASSSTGAQPKR